MAAGCEHWAAMAGGTAMLLHPLALQNLEAIQLVPLWGMLWTLESLLRFEREPSWRAGCCVGLGFGATCLTCLHHALFFLIVLAVSIWTVLPYGRLRSAIPGGIIALGTSLCIALPLILPMRAYQAQFELVRSPEVVKALSATTSDWLTCQSTAWFSPHVGLQREVGEFPLLPGALRSSLALICLPLTLRYFPIAARMLTVMLVTSFLCSFGPNASLGGWSPWESMSDSISVMALVRSPYRFAYLGQMAIILLASLAFGGMLRRMTRSESRSSQNRNRWRQLTAVGVAAVALAVLIGEVIPARSYLCFPPSPVHREAWVDYLVKHTDAQAPIVCLPVARNVSESANERETKWMMYATMHRHPILNGYSGFTPKPWRTLSGLLRQQPISPAALSGIAELGAKYVVIKKDQTWPAGLREWEQYRMVGLSTVFEDSRYVILRIAQRQRDGG